jgi:hypothetical protein
MLKFPSVLSKEHIMASKKILRGDHIMKVLFNADSEDDLIPYSDSSQSSGSERPESTAIFVISDILDEATPKTLPSHCLPLPAFTANACLNTDIENTDVMKFVKLFITFNFPEYVCEETNLHAS